MHFLSLRCKGEYAEKKWCEKFNIVKKAREFSFWSNVPPVNGVHQRMREMGERFSFVFFFQGSDVF